jgi:hypothetical protein
MQKMQHAWYVSMELQLEVAMRSALSVLYLVVAVGCSSSFGPGTIDGRWAQDGEPPGSSFEMDLVANGSAISGTGTWSGEACCSGTLAVTGTFDKGAVHLDILQTVGPAGGGTAIPSRFDGKLVVSRLVGTLTIQDPANLNNEVSYHRVGD